MGEEIAECMRKVNKAVENFKIYQYDKDSPYKTTEQYGFMKFDTNEIVSARLPQYIRLSLETNAETVVRFMQQGWGLSTPDLIISVTGGAKNCDMSARLRKIFQRGLVAAAITTNAWLITAGTNAGVVKEVGEALNNYRYKNQTHGLDVPCIGIGSWGYTAGNEQLDPQPHIPSQDMNNTKGHHMYERRTQAIHALQMEVADQYCVRDYIVKERPKKRCELEANHTHFLLFDDGQPNADNVLQLRGEIEKASRNINLQTTTEGTAVDTLIPIVMVLVEGGPSSVRTICQALESETPVVVVKESGRAADLVAELHACYSENENSSATGHPSRPQTALFGKGNSREAEINAILAKARIDNSWIDEVKDDLCKILNKRKQLVTIFKFDSKQHHGNLEDAILEALFAAAKFSGDGNENHRRTAEFKLAMAWHKFDRAQKYLLTDTTISKWKEDDLRLALVDALRRGHVDFVELLIEFGTSLEKLTYGDLKQLYATALGGNGLPIKHNGMRSDRTRDRFYKDYFKFVLVNPTMCNDILSSDDKNPLGKNAPRDLFLWAIFLDRFELATYLCSKTWNPSISPLFGAQIYRRAARLTLDLDTKKQYEANADQFDMHSTNIIDRCFDNDENFGIDILKRKVASFDDALPLQIAQKADCRAFLASKCVQRYLDIKWFGCINFQRKAINFRVFLCSLFFPLIPIFCIFLPYVQRHKQMTRSTRDHSKLSQPAMIKSGVEPDRRKTTDHVRLTEKIVYFYEAPIVRFYYYTIFFIMFLGLFSFVLLVDYFPLNIHNGRRSGFQGLVIPITEIILHICLWSLIIEELRQFIFSNSKREYYAELWNKIDILAILLYLVGFITRFFVLESLFAVSKISLCLDLLLWYVRTLHLFAAYEKLGPKLVMIFKTMKDLLFFLCFLCIFLLGYSVASWSLINTTNQVNWTYTDDGSLYNVTVVGGGSGLWTWQLLHDVTNFGVWKIFGQVDPITGTDSYSAVAFVLAILFLAIANVLLLNVLVALFNVTIRNIEKQSHRIWRYQRFLIVFEYGDKPPLPPPFNIIYYVFCGFRYIYKKIKSAYNKCRRVANEPSEMDPGDTNDKNVRDEFKVTDPMQRESAIADDYWQYTLKHGKKDQIEVALQNIEQKLHDLKDRLQNNNTQVLNYDHQLFPPDA